MVRDARCSQSSLADGRAGMREQRGKQNDRKEEAEAMLDGSLVGASGDTGFRKEPG